MFHLTIVTAEQTIYEGEIISLVAPAVDGEIGILTNHHPIVTKLGPGAMRLTKEDRSEERLFVTGGYLEVKDNKAIILADVIENIEAIQAEEAKQARLKAQQLVAKATTDVERERLMQELQIQLARERFAQIGSFARRAGGSLGGSKGKSDMNFENGPQ